MAEGAHLTSAVNNETPSIFEVLAQESLMSAIKPALKHAVRVFAENRPDRYGLLLKYYEEIYTVLDLVLEGYYLKKYCASFAENFYGLKRVPVTETSASSLPRKAFWKSLFCLVCLPYIKQKLDEKFEDLRHALNTNPGSLEISRLKKAFVAVYPYIHTGWEGAILWYQAAYMFGKTDWHTPFLPLSDVILTYDSEPADDTGQSSNLQPWHDLRFQQKLLVVLKKSFNMAAVTVSTGLSVGVFFIQFLDWWYANDVNATSLTSLPVPDPPEVDSKDIDLPYDSHVCPICHRQRSNDTALSVSGYVFCYPCVYDYVKQYGICPVTNYPARTDHLIKLYLDDS